MINPLKCAMMDLVSEVHEMNPSYVKGHHTVNSSHHYSRHYIDGSVDMSIVVEVSSFIKRSHEYIINEKSQEVDD